MNGLKFKDYLRIEQVRQLEGEGDAEVEAPDNLSGAYEERLLQRANAYIKSNQLEPAIERPERAYQRSRLVAVVLAVVLGIAAVSNALFVGSGQANTINIYWLLLVLLLFNAVSIVLWLLGCFTGLGNLMAGTVGRFPSKLLGWFGGRKEPASVAWYQSRFGGRLGVWHLSALSHHLWLVYLFAGLLTLIILFSVRQYDFYWGSTLLPESAFTRLTEWLSWPLAHLGLAVPDSNQVSGSRVGLAADSAARSAWAMFLLGALVLYGILPRLLCWLIAKLQLLRKQKQFRPDFYLPYYVALRQSMFPASSEAYVVDADQYPEEKVTLKSPAVGNLSLPDGALLIGLETSRRIAEKLDVNIVDNDSLNDANERVSTSRQTTVAVVDSRAAPDRGLQRKLNNLLQPLDHAQRWLLVEGASDTDTQRLTDWYAAARRAGIPAQQVQVGRL